jgi:hypothetical protein
MINIKYTKLALAVSAIALFLSPVAVCSNVVTSVDANGHLAGRSEKLIKDKGDNRILRRLYEKAYENGKLVYLINSTEFRDKLCECGIGVKYNDDLRVSERKGRLPRLRDQNVLSRVSSNALVRSLIENYPIFEGLVIFTIPPEEYSPIIITKLFYDFIAGPSISSQRPNPESGRNLGDCIVFTIPSMERTISIKSFKDYEDLLSQNGYLIGENCKIITNHGFINTVAVGGEARAWDADSAASVSMRSSFATVKVSFDQSVSSSCILEEDDRKSIKSIKSSKSWRSGCTPGETALHRGRSLSPLQDLQNLQITFDEKDEGSGSSDENEDGSLLPEDRSEESSIDEDRENCLLFEDDLFFKDDLFFEDDDEKKNPGDSGQDKAERKTIAKQQTLYHMKSGHLFTSASLLSKHSLTLREQGDFNIISTDKFYEKELLGLAGGGNEGNTTIEAGLLGIEFSGERLPDPIEGIDRINTPITLEDKKGLLGLAGGVVSNE